MTFDELVPQPGQHLIGIGQNGVGKSYLLGQICARRQYVQVFDAKDEIRWRGFVRVHTIKDLVKRGDRRTQDGLPQYPKIVYAPLPGGELRDPEAHQIYWAYALERRNVLAAADEVYAFSRRGVPHAYLDCLTRGRSMRISVVTLTQRPTWFPLEALTEAKLVVSFRVTYADDADRAAELVGASREQIQGLPNRAFFVRLVDSGQTVGPLTLSPKQGLQAA